MSISVSILEQDSKDVVIWYADLFAVVLAVDKRTGRGAWRLQPRWQYINLQWTWRLECLRRRAASSFAFRTYWRVRHWAF